MDCRVCGGAIGLELVSKSDPRHSGPKGRGTARTGSSSARERLRKPKRAGLAPKKPHCQNSRSGSMAVDTSLANGAAGTFSSAGPALSASAKVTMSHDTPSNPEARHWIPTGVIASRRTLALRESQFHFLRSGLAVRQAAVDDASPDSPLRTRIRDPRGRALTDLTAVSEAESREHPIGNCPERSKDDYPDQDPVQSLLGFEKLIEPRPRASDSLGLPRLQTLECLGLPRL